MWKSNSRVVLLCTYIFFLTICERRHLFLSLQLFENFALMRSLESRQPLSMNSTRQMPHPLQILHYHINFTYYCILIKCSQPIIPYLKEIGLSFHYPKLSLFLYWRFYEYLISKFKGIFGWFGKVHQDYWWSYQCQCYLTMCFTYLTCTSSGLPGMINTSWVYSACLPFFITCTVMKYEVFSAIRLLFTLSSCSTNSLSPALK